MQSFSSQFLKIFLAFNNFSYGSSNLSSTTATKSLAKEVKPPNPIAEIVTGHAAEKEQQSDSMKIFFILIVLGEFLALSSQTHNSCS